ncbi:hypothetical protein CBR_g45382 [Chara braunii]|uniref:Myb/SANT-like DNA-binding domain-containing protein n=1 Tax=Chara braunii TaxID=69332 RepID=A0A388LYI6_CHABU|nr:hypothetical protein CBR_g45382 [Chara braunii]|eukprot:GBG87323.1 hypothetical protein CBR_g45382 [Chara braunii]
MAVVQPRQKHQRRSVRNDWVARRMKEDGYHRSAEDVRKKWTDLQNKYREIHDKCGGSGKPSFWDMSAEDKKREGLTFLFEEELWEEMAWVQGKRSTMCDNTMESSALPGAHSGGSDNGTCLGTPQEDSESSRKSRRTERRKASAEEGCSSSRSVSRFSMEESTRTLCAGLGDAAGTLARANAEGAQQMPLKLMRAHNRQMEFCKEVAGHTVRYYEVRVDGMHAMDSTAGMGCDAASRLAHVLLFASKRNPIIPDKWDGNYRDVVGDIIRYLVDAMVEEFAERLDDSPFYRCELDPPLEGRGYLHGPVQSWMPEDDLRVRKW